MEEDDDEEEFILDRILAEKLEDGRKIFLVKWQEYNWYDWSWEPEESFNKDGTIEEWRQRQLREAAGYRESYDYRDFDRRWIAHWNGEEPEPPEPPEDSEAEAGAEPDNQAQPDSDPQYRIEINATAGDCGDGCSLASHPPQNNEIVSKIHILARPASPKEGSGKLPTQHAEATRKYAATSKPTQKVKPGAQFDLRPSTSNTVNLKSARRTSKPLGNKALASAVVERAHRNKGIFDNWERGKRKRTASTLEPSKEARLFKNIATRRRVEISSRNERPPDLGSLTLYSAKDGAVVRNATSIIPLRPTQTHSSTLSPIPTSVDLLRIPRQPPPTPSNYDKAVLSPKDGEVRTNALVNPPRMNEQQSPILIMAEKMSTAPEADLCAVDDSLFLTQSTMAEIVAVPSEHHLHEIETSNSECDRDTKHSQDPLLIRSLSIPETSTQGPSKRRLFGDAVRAKIRRMSVPNGSLLVKQHTPVMEPPDDPLAMEFHRMTGNPGGYKGEIFGNLIVGQNREKDASVAFSGLPNYLKPLFLTIKRHPKKVHVWVTKTCNAAECFEYYHFQGAGYLGAGHVRPFPQTRHTLREVAEALRRTKTGGLFFAERYTLLLYPTNSDDWAFMDDRYTTSKDYEELRFVLRTPVPFTQTLSSNTEFKRLVKHTGSSCPTTPTEKPHLEVHQLFMSMDNDEVKNRLKLWIEDMCPPPTKNNDPVKFFLFFPPAFKQQHDIMVACLRDCAGVRSYSCFEDGEWHLFRQHVKRGVVLLHCTQQNYHEIPYLHRVLRNGSMRVLSIDLSIGKPSEAFTDQLFRSGCAFAILDSTFLSEPKSACRILQWYQRCVIPTKEPRTWKLIVRPRFKTWLKDRINDTESSNKEENLLEIFEEYLKIVPNSMVDPADPYETPIEKSPLIMPSTIAPYIHQLTSASLGSEELAKNDDQMVRWFGNWSLTQTHRHRRLYIVCDNNVESAPRARQWAKDWQHVTIMTVNDFEKVERVEENLASYERRLAGR